MKSSTFSLLTVATAAVSIAASGRGEAYGSACDGGSLMVTPYSATEIVKPAQVANNLAAASQRVTVTCGDFSALKAKVVDGKKTFYALTGIANNGVVATYDLARLEFIKVVDPAIKNGKVQIELTVFPTITPVALVSLQPSFTTLDKSYRKTIQLLCGKDCKIVGQIEDDSGKPKTSSMFLRDIPAGETMRFFSKEIWWAIPSVVDDPHYPFKKSKA